MATELERTTVLDALYDAGLDEEALCEDYSGRLMYGEKCIGIVGGPGDASKFLIALADAEPEIAERMTDRESGDSMGLQSITYWPGFQIAGAA